MKIYNKIIFSFVIALSIFACNREKPVENPPLINEIKIDQTNFLTLADTIITDVVIKNPDNDEWTDYCLRNLNRETLVNNLFELVYSEKLIPYDFFTDSVMTIKEIKRIERNPEYARENTAKVQFEESWSFDTENQKMIKKVHSIMIAYELYSQEGNVKGYKPIFKVYLNQ
jgi:hypothetical protein